MSGKNDDGCCTGNFTVNISKDTTKEKYPLLIIASAIAGA